MKKSTIIIILLILFVCYHPTALAAQIHTGLLTDVLKETNRDIIADVLTSDKLPNSLENVELDGQPMLVVFNLYFHAYADRSYEDIISRAMKEPINLYILCQEPILLRESSDKSSVGVVYNTEPLPAYVQDIINGSAVQTFLGQSATVSNILCFDASSSHFGTTVIYETDKGKFVRYYCDSSASVMEFSWDDYIEDANAYYAYISSYGANHNGIGMPLSGRVSFSMYLANPERYPVVTLWDRIAPFVIGIGGVIVVLVAVSLIQKKLREKRFTHGSQ